MGPAANERFRLTGGEVEHGDLTVVDEPADRRNREQHRSIARKHRREQMILLALSRIGFGQHLWFATSGRDAEQVRLSESLVANTIVSSVPQVAPRGVPGKRTGEWPARRRSETFLSSLLPGAKNPIDRLFGEKNGEPADVTPRIGLRVESIEAANEQLLFVSRHHP